LLDPFVALTAVTMATRNLRIATGVCLVLQHDTVALAKRVATLDVLSGGRVLFGVGAGWNRAEMKTHGVDPSTRMDAMVEVTEALQAMWTQDEAQYAGTYVRFAPLWSWPKPKQSPHPPVLMGGNHHNTLRRVVRTGSEWLPNLGRLDEEGLARRLGELRALAAERGAPAPATTAFRINPKAQVIEQLTELGVHRSVIALPPGDESATRYRLERFSPLLKDFATR